MRSGADLYAWLASLPPSERDAEVEHMLGIPACSSASPGEHLVGHHMIGLSAIVRALHAVPVRADDVVLDLGAGVGKLVALVSLLSGASARGLEIQPDLVARAVAKVAHGDARSSSYVEDGRTPSVIFLYCPFEGPALDEVTRRLDELDDVVVCALGVDLRCTRLRRRPNDDFWMTIWDSGTPRIPLEMPPLAQRLAHDRSDQ